MSLFEELKRRNVFRVGTAYVVASWLVIQVVETIFPAFGFGDVAVRVATIVLAIGLIPTLIFAWAFEFTPEGLKREKDIERAGSVPPQAGKRLDRMIMVVLALSLGYFAFDKFVLEPRREVALREEQATAVEQARQEGRSDALVESYGDLSIAVLPFADMSPEGDQEYLSDGIAEELLNLLARIPDLRVISRTSSFAFKGLALDVPEIARRLKVGHVLEGSVRKAGDRVRVTAQLIEARSDTHLWSRTWDRELTDVFAMQDEIAAAVSTSLQVLLLPSSAGSNRLATQGELEAYERVLRGRYLMTQADPDAYRKALTNFEEATALAPDYAPAHAGLAKVLRQMVAFGALDPGATGPRIEAALDRALALDPEDPDALTTRGMIVARGGKGFAEARAYWRRAIAANPSDSDAYRWLGWSYKNVDSIQYLEYIRKGYQVAPTNVMVNVNLVAALSRFGRHDEALAVAADLHALDPDRPLAFALAGDVLRRSGHLDQALQCFYRAFRMAPSSAGEDVANVVWLLLESVHPPASELAMAWVEVQLAKEPDSAVARFQQIVLEHLQGHQEKAVELMADMAAHHPAWSVILARTYLLVAGDAESSRRWWESGLESEDELRLWDIYRLVDYALALQQTGEASRARELINSTLARTGQQMGAGVRSEGQWDLAFYAAMLHALKGQTQQALDYLRQDADHGGLSCVDCLRQWPHFAAMREVQEIQALIAEQEAFDARWLQRLAGEGLLLTPRQVLEREDFDFDPFAGRVAPDGAVGAAAESAASLEQR